jgi:hypothetical protein
MASASFTSAALMPDVLCTVPGPITFINIG